MSALKQILANPRLQLLAVFGAILGVIALVAAWQLGVDMETLKLWWEHLDAFLRANPWAMFLGLVFLPGLPFPMSALLLAAAFVWGPTWQGCGLVLLALAMNMTWTYFVAAYPARRLIERILVGANLKIPDLPGGGHVILILFLRLTPGIPLFIHNYLLGFLRTPFRLYLPLSLVMGGPVALGIYLTGGALFDGKWGLLALGVVILLAAFAGIYVLRRWMAKRQGASEPDPAAEI